MADLDLPTLTQNALKLGLLTEPQLMEGLEEVGSRTADPQTFLRFMERKGYLTPWQTGKLVKGDLSGYFLGGYRLLYKIAAGTFGRVYRADDPHTGTIVAIKVLRRRFSEDPRQIELFEREGKIGLALQHPNIVPILAIQQDPGSKQYYIAMEFIEGGNLRDFLGIRKKLEAAEALRLMEEATSGLAYAYERSVTHRDIKLSNILISSQGSVKLVDFGLFMFTRVGLQIEESDKVDRTVDYAGLEKATGAPSGDTRSDIFFLGCILYHMLTGRPPLGSPRSARERMRRQRFDSIRPLSREEVKAPPSVFHLVETMMALNPLHRYQSPVQMLEAIRDVRRLLEGPKENAIAEPTVRTVFVAEHQEPALNVIRDKLRELGYRVFLSTDPAHAVDRYRTNPFDALVVNVGSTGEEGRAAYQSIWRDAERQGRRLAVILVFEGDQAEWAKEVPSHPLVAILKRPVGLKQLREKLLELAPPSPR